MRKINRDPKRYEYVEQEEYCCVGATLEMVLRRHGIREYSQDIIACELGLLVPEDCEDCPDCAIRVPRDRTTGEYEYQYLGFLMGTQLDKIGGLNTFFLRHDLPFLEIYIPASQIGSPEHLRKILQVYREEDVIVCCQVISNGEKYRHVCC